MTRTQLTDFDDWLIKTFARVGWFTLLIVLLDIDDTMLSPVASLHLHIIGDETRWSDIVDALSETKISWDGAAFFEADKDGFVDETIAQQRLSSLTRRLEYGRSMLNYSELFDARGRRLKIDEFEGIELPRFH